MLGEVRAWQARPLDAIYPILYRDALQVKVKSQGRPQNEAIYLALGVRRGGTPFKKRRQLVNCRRDFARTAA